MLTYNDLVDDMASGCKPRTDWRIGIEYERFGYDVKTGAPLPYESIRALLLAYAARTGWEVQYEGRNPIGLMQNGQTVTLEPGGQIEYSGSPLPDLAAVQREGNAYLKHMDDAAAALGIGFMPVGFPPTWKRTDIHWMPKPRYAIMRPYMETVGSMGVDMMSRTCGAQINVDFSSEADMIKKFRVALALQPVVIALMANSRMVEGRDSGFASYRAHIWTDTDNARSGFLPFVFADDMSFARYVDYALSVPMYFVRRDGQYINAAGQSFLDFMAGQLPALPGEYPMMGDWHDHLTTLFPDVRLKKYLELRGPDSHTPDMVYAMAGFWTGLIYSDDVLDEAAALVESFPALIAADIRTNVARDGLATKLPGTKWADLCALAGDILPLAEKGLQQDRGLLLPFWAKLEESCPARRKQAV
ncbi:MAG: glutamate--cysteine ligase [Alphaproteobacteria bacterium]|nr:glutamate--cysteine ligase [Alphaproteobacteria bacterium]MBU0859051.1 glutamate--cysteine ligase [Alphaproteobacteria bacterium]